MVEQTDDRGLAVVATHADPPPQAVMVCPVCGFENLMGVDECANCGSDLRTSDIPHASTDFERLLTEVPLRAVSTRAPIAVSADATVAEVLATMRDQKTADVLVVVGGKLVGIFTERDALAKLTGADGSVDQSRYAAMTVKEVMTHDPVVLRADDSIAVAVQKMAIGGFRHIPLVDEGRPIGVVSAIDVFRHLLRIVD